MQKIGSKRYGITILFALLMIVVLVIPSFSQTGALLTLGSNGMVFQNVMTPAWSINEIVPPAQQKVLNDGVVNFPITVTKGETTNNVIKVISYVHIVNTGDEKANIGNVVVALQQLNDHSGVLHWDTLSYDVANSDIGDIASIANTTFGEVKQNSASSFLEFLDKSNTIEFLNHPAASLDSQEAVDVRVCAQFNNNILGMAIGGRIRALVFVTYGNAADATGFNMDINGNGIIDPDEARVRSKYIISDTVFPKAIQRDDEVVLTGPFIKTNNPVTITNFNDGGIGAGITLGSGDPAGTVYNFNVSFNANANPDNAVIRSKVNLDSAVILGSIHKRAGAHVWVGNAPDASPSNLIATPGAVGQINLAWVDNTTNELGFILERSTSPDFLTKTKIFDIPANSTSFTDTGLTSGTTYYYKITATNEIGSSPLSSVASAIAP